MWDLAGPLCFGMVIGWVTYRTLRRSQGNGLSDIATVIGAVGGGAVTALWKAESGAFSVYSVGLAIGFFGYLIVAVILKTPDTLMWLGGTDSALTSGGAQKRPE